MRSFLNKWLDGFYKDIADIELLEHIKQILEGDQEDHYRLNKSLCVKAALGYKGKEEFNQRCDSLMKRGYLTQSKNFLFITEEGRDYLKDYHQYQKLGIFAKFTKIFQQNFSAVLSILAIIISTISLIVSIIKT